MITQYLLRKVLDAALRKGGKLLAVERMGITSTKDKIEQSIDHHVSSVKIWAEQVSFSDLGKEKWTTDIFVDLDLFIIPRRLHLQTATTRESVKSIPIRELFLHHARHVFLLGQPGAGKTTSMKFLCQALFYEEDFYRDRFSFPILIRLRELSNLRRDHRSTIIIDTLYDILGLQLDTTTDRLKQMTPVEIMEARERLAITVLDELQVLLILDGLDELGPEEYRVRAYEEIRRLALHLKRATMVVTTRTGEFTLDVDNSVQYEICPLNRAQISSFALKWLEDETRAADFINKIYDSPFADTAIRPLTLAHLCAYYDRLGVIPEKPKSVYRKTVNLLLEEWDRQRSVKRYTKYAEFDVDRKQEFLWNLAYVLTTSLQSSVFSKDDLITAYNLICSNFDLLRSDAHLVVAELETHTGLFVQTGSERFEFAHKSLQEYLTAEYVVKLPSLPFYTDTLSKIPNEIAIAVVISSNPTDYFSELVLSRLRVVKISEEFITIFLSRLLLEKPDFNANPKLGLALLVLYTKYFEKSVVGGTMLEPPHVDKVIKEFETLIRSTLRRSSIGTIIGYYRSGRVFKMVDGDDFHLLYKNDASIDYRAPIAFTNYPELICIRQSVLREIDSSSTDS